MLWMFVHDLLRQSLEFLLLKRLEKGCLLLGHLVRLSGRGRLFFPVASRIQWLWS